MGDCQFPPPEEFHAKITKEEKKVRHHGDLARIETDEDGFLILTDRKNREKVHTQLKQYGFTYTAIDLLGYRTGSMNETLNL